MRIADQISRHLSAQLHLSDMRPAGAIDSLKISHIGTFPGESGSPRGGEMLRMPDATHGNDPPPRAIASEHARLITDVRSLEAIREGWRAIEPAAFGPIEQYEWSRACMERLDLLGHLKVFSVWENGRCRALAPLVTSARRCFRLESMGVHELTEPMDLVYADRSALARLCQALARQRAPINLPRVPSSSPVAEEMRRAFRGRALVHVSRSSPYPVLHIDASWSDPESHFNPGRRSDFRRAQRAAERFGALTFEVVTPRPETFEALLQEALEAELHSWKGRNGTALLLDGMRNKIYHHYLRAICEKGTLRMAFMRIDGKAVAMQIVVETNHRLWLLKIGHNEDYSKCSPGTLLMLHVARYAATHALRSIEFLGSAESWTRMWTQDLRECVQVRVYTLGFASAIALGYDVWRSTRTRILRRLKRA